MITPGSTVDFVGLVDEIERLTRGSPCGEPTGQMVEPPADIRPEYS